MAADLRVVSPVSGRPLEQRMLLAGQTIPVNIHARIDSSAGIVAVSAPLNVFDDGVFIVEDAGGAAATNPITINGNGRLIDGAATFVLSVNSGVVCFVVSGNAWFRVVLPRQFSPPAEAGALFRVADLPGAPSPGGGAQGIYRTPANTAGGANIVLTAAQEANWRIEVNGLAGGPARTLTFSDRTDAASSARNVKNNTDALLTVKTATGVATVDIGAGLSDWVGLDAGGVTETQT